MRCKIFRYDSWIYDRKAFTYSQEVRDNNQPTCQCVRSEHDDPQHIDGSSYPVEPFIKKAAK